MPARLIVSVHAQIRFLERGIDLAAVKQTVLNPDLLLPAHAGRTVARKKLDDDREMEVIYLKQDFRKTNEYFILTAYYKGL